MIDPRDKPLSRQGGLYAALWRLHFFAGLIVAPVLLLMAATGGLYLFKAEIDGLLYGRLTRAPASEVRLPPSAWVAAAEAATGGEARRLTLPAEGQAAAVLVRLPDGVERLLHLDPADARLIGESPPGGALGWIKRLHSLETFGPWANLLAEIAAGWAILLVVTGAVLWWPRPGQPAIALRGSPARRPFWRDLHALIGVFTGAVILFLAATGMPWSAVWGQQVRAITNQAGWGRPEAPPAAGGWRPAPAAEAGTHTHGAMPWALQGEALAARTPARTEFANAIDAAAAATSQRMAPPFDLTLSRDP
ncbi:PepSY domain-containing protein, partial [Phenylobacterium sp.]|uniref:PepSY-associated TM helix domain-containing protein n=1 Tax=Phenylobacterium sp. TaxID=1871053 RepID=UPI00198A57C5